MNKETACNEFHTAWQSIHDRFAEIEDIGARMQRLGPKVASHLHDPHYAAWCLNELATDLNRCHGLIDSLGEAIDGIERKS